MTDTLAYLPPQIQKNGYETIKIMFGTNHLQEVIEYLTRNGYDNFQIEYPKNEDGHVIEKRLMVATADKHTSTSLYKWGEQDAET